MSTSVSGANTLPYLHIEKGSSHVNVDQARLPYILRRNLGSGGCGIVEEVEERHTGELFARKVFYTTRRNKQRLREVFENEVKILKYLGQHRHLIEIHASYSTENQLALVLSPVADGGDLDHFLGRYKALLDDLRLNKSTESQVQCNTMYGILWKSYGCLASGLSYLHQRKIRHKDIKTQNILVHRGRVLYTDFGLSLDANLLENSTTEGPTDMTRRYAAPEVLVWQERNSSSDIFSLGCVFIEILGATGEIHGFQEPEQYASSMPRIQEQMLMVQQASEVHNVVSRMTQHELDSRGTAAIAVKQLLLLGRSCQRCQQEHLPGTPESLPQYNYQQNAHAEEISRSHLESTL